MINDKENSLLEFFGTLLMTSDIVGEVSRFAQIFSEFDNMILKLCQG